MTERVEKEIEGPGVGELSPESADPGSSPNQGRCKCGHWRNKHEDGGRGICEKARWCKCTGFEQESMAIVKTDPKHAGEYELIRQQGNLSAEEWPDARILAVRQMYGSEAKNSAQLAVFLGIASKHHLDPALNEIWLIQTSKGPKTYSGRDGFLRSASYHPEMFGGVQSGVVYASDDFRVRIYRDAEDPSRQIAVVEHEFDPRERTGKPHGAYAIAWDGHGHPTYVYREYEKCKQSRSTYWTEHPDDAIQNRALAGALRRVVPLGGVLIEGEEPVGSTAQIEKQVASGTRAKLRELRATIIGPEEEDGPDVEVEVDADGQPSMEELHELLDRLASKHDVPPEALLAWAKAAGSFPDDPEDWNEDHLTLACQELEASDGLDMIRELANHLAEQVNPGAWNDMDERLELLEEVANCQDREKLDELVASLRERAS